MIKGHASPSSWLSLAPVLNRATPIEAEMSARLFDGKDERKDQWPQTPGSSAISKIALTLSVGGWQSCTRAKSVGRLCRRAPPDSLPAHKILKLKAAKTPVVRNALTPLPLWRRVLFTVSAVALVGSAVALQPVAHAGTAGTPTPTPTRKFQLLATDTARNNSWGLLP